MEKGFKILAFIYLLAGIGLVSCEKTYIYLDEEEPEAPIYEDPGPNMVVEFDGFVWVAEKFETQVSPTYLVIISSGWMTNENQFPRFEWAIEKIIEEGIYEDVIDANVIDANSYSYGNRIIRWVEYYQDASYTIGGAAYGDWWAKEVKINIENIDLTSLKISFDVTATMFEALSVLEYDESQSTYLINLSPELLSTADTKNLNISASNIPLVLVELE